MSQSLKANRTPVKIAQTPYRDLYIGLDRYELCGEGDFQTPPFWVITYADQTYESDGRYNSGQGYTTSKSLAKFCFYHLKWPTRGYKIDKEDVQGLIDSLDAKPHRFGLHPCLECVAKCAMTSTSRNRESKPP